MSFRRSPYLAAAAARERDLWTAKRGEVVAAGHASAAEADEAIRCWTLLAELLDAGSAETELNWAELEAFAAAQLRRREAALAGGPHSQGSRGERARERRDAVESIHHRIAWHRRWVGPFDQRISVQDAA